MADPTPSARLPERPSREYLRQAAKRLARAEKIRLAHAQARLARDHGHRNWSELMQAVDAAAEARQGPSPLSAAAAHADVEVVRELLAEGAPPDGRPDEIDTPLFLACGSEAPADRRLEVATLLIEGGALVRRGCTNGARPLHAAARRGPAALAELLLRNGALYWQPDRAGLRPYDYARDSTPIDRDTLLYMLAEGPKLEDPDFRAAVAAIHRGDVQGLADLLDRRPSLLTERAIEPDFGARGYFSDPRLFWFVANNPTLIPTPPPNIVEIAGLMIARGVAREDLDYTLELVMTDGQMPREMQMDLVRTLVEAGAGVSRQGVLMTLGHAQTRPIAWLVERGMALTPAIAAGLGRTAELQRLLPAASPDEIGEALAMATINRHSEAARLCLEAGADPNRFMPVHVHSMPLHQSAINGDVETMKLLVAHGARRDVQDTIWQGTPLGWAIHGRQQEAEAYLRGFS
jgi:peptide-methionine (S)-S-oxide reductase